ncbi:MAG: response regulator [Desulfobacterales bacterium]|nr:response regulator [Desulfobacterales bacterium]
MVFRKPEQRKLQVVKHSLSQHFSFALTTVVTVILIGFSTIVVFYNISSAENELKNYTAHISGQAETSLPTTLWDYNGHAAKDFVDAVFLKGTVVFAKVITDTNIVLAEKKRSDIQEKDFDFFEQSSGYITKTVTIEKFNRKVGFFQVAISRENIQHELFLNIAGIIALMLIVMTAISITSVVITRRYVFNPLLKLAESAEMIAKGNLDVSITSDRCDEIGSLADDFNTMRESVKHADEKLKEYARTLEKKVEQRTENLKKKNEELQKTFLKLEESRIKADAANRAKSEFLANMSHELRTPLNAVTGFSELLSSLVSDRKQKSYLASIKTAGKSLLTLINDILDLSKIEAGMMEIRLTPVNPRMIISEIEQIFSMKIASENLQFVTDIDTELPCVLMLDETRFRQILLNLVGNAVKFTEKGHIKLAAENRYRTDDRTRTDLIISVEDTGIGIPRQERENIFKSFRQQDGQSSKYGGTGLGLSICRKLTEMMNGRITVDSRPGAGSIFRIILRDAEVLSSEIPVAKEKIFDIDNTAFEKAKILVADDVDSNRDMLNELLSRVNLDVLTAENGQEAVLLAREYQPDVILMDIRMPVMDGIEATKRLKENPKTGNIPIIAVTASSTAHDRSEILAEGLDGYVTKPVKLNTLFDELSRYLRYTEKNSRQPAERNNQLKYPAYDDIERLPELVSTLRTEILPSLHELQGVMLMGDIEEFGNRLQDLGKEHNVRELIAYGEYLKEFAQNFDIRNIDNIFKELLETSEQLNKMAGRFA